MLKVLQLTYNFPTPNPATKYNAFRSIPWQTRTYLRTWQHQMTTMKQPFQCNLQPEIQEPHRTTHTDTTTRCKTHRRKQFAHKTTAAAPVAQTRYLSSSAHFPRKNTRFGAPASSPKHSPCNIHAAITMRFAASRGKPAPIYARGNIK